MKDSHGRHGGNHGRTDKGGPRTGALRRRSTPTSTAAAPRAIATRRRAIPQEGNDAMNDTRQLDQIHQKADKDLKRNPGIGQSKGSFATGIPPDEIEGENTVEGDTENNAGPSGEVKLGRERTNK